MAKKLMEGNQALAEAAIHAECRYFFGYPITPQSEIPEYLSRRLPQVGGVYLQAESEVSAINMVFGAAATGARVLTASSSPGISLMSEGISYIAACQLPCVIINVQRGGPGLGNISPSQADYNQATKGIGHGDFHRWSCLTRSEIRPDRTAFELHKYRNRLWCWLTVWGDDGTGGIKHRRTRAYEKPWATVGAKNERGTSSIPALTRLCWKVSTWFRQPNMPGPRKRMPL